MAKKRVKKRSPPKRSSKKSRKEYPKIVSPKKVRKTTKSLLYSLAAFIISWVLYVVSIGFWESIFGLIAIISGAFVVLFAIIEIIFFFVRRKENSN
ncbi:MAG: hypothetical protein Q8Q04_01775 [archaeon]|nr:hypothetical protein [archaeon]